MVKRMEDAVKTGNSPAASYSLHFLVESYFHLIFYISKLQASLGESSPCSACLTVLIARFKRTTSRQRNAHSLR